MPLGDKSERLAHTLRESGELHLPKNAPNQPSKKCAAVCASQQMQFDLEKVVCVQYSVADGFVSLHIYMYCSRVSKVRILPTRSSSSSHGFIQSSPWRLFPSFVAPLVYVHESRERERETIRLKTHSRSYTHTRNKRGPTWDTLCECYRVRLH